MSQVSTETRKQKQRKRHKRHVRLHPKHPAVARVLRSRGNTASQTENGSTPEPVNQNQPISVLKPHGLHQRTIDSLVAKGVKTLADLTNTTVEQLQAWRFGSDSINRVAKALKAFGSLHLRRRDRVGS